MVEYKVLNSIQMSNFINLQIKKVVATIKNANGYLKELFNHCSVIKNANERCYCMQFTKHITYEEKKMKTVTKSESFTKKNFRDEFIIKLYWLTCSFVHGLTHSTSRYNPR